MKIKIIDLFNKIANNEKVPNHIISNNVIFHYDDNVKDYENDFEYLFRDSFSNFGRSDEFLNIEVEEVEIIEEEKEIEKITLQFSETQKEKNRLFKDKINEMID